MAVEIVVAIPMVAMMVVRMVSVSVDELDATMLVGGWRVDEAEPMDGGSEVASEAWVLSCPSLHRSAYPHPPRHPSAEGSAVA